jgi:hypothetical protein
MEYVGTSIDQKTLLPYLSPHMGFVRAQIVQFIGTGCTRINDPQSLDVHWHRARSVREEGHVSASKRPQPLAVGGPARYSAPASARLQRAATRAACNAARSYPRQRRHSHGGERSVGVQWPARRGCSDATKTTAFRGFHALREGGGARGGSV